MAQAPHAIALPSRLGIANVSAFRKELTELLDGPDSIDVVADGVERVDAAGLQLLVAFVAARRDAGHTVAWREPSEAFLQTVRTLGLGSALGL